MAHTTEKIIDKIKELKGTVLPSGKLILFGSQARREAMRPEVARKNIQQTGEYICKK